MEHLNEVERKKAEIRMNNRQVRRLKKLYALADARAEQVVALQAELNVRDLHLQQAMRTNDAERGMQLLSEMGPLLKQLQRLRKSEMKLDARLLKIIAEMRQAQEA